ncbi:MAG: hypothetical protein ABF901_09525, partial [Leuconostoc suionicum]
VDGKNGVDGKDGVNGIDGQNGVDGKDGVNGIDGKNGADGKDGVNGIDGKHILVDSQEVSNSIESKDVIDNIDNKNGRDRTENFKSSTLSTFKISDDSMEKMIVKEEHSSTENNNQIQEDQVSTNDVDKVPSQKLAGYYQADHNSDDSTFPVGQLKENNLSGNIEEKIGSRKSEQNQSEIKTSQPDNLEAKDNSSDVSCLNQTADELGSQKDLEKHKMEQFKDKGLQLPKTNGHRDSASVLEALILGMLIIISKLYKKIKI